MENEFDLLDLPRSDAVVYLHMDVETSQGLRVSTTAAI